MHTKSWVIKEIATNKVIVEIRDKKILESLNTEKYVAVPIEQHLKENDHERFLHVIEQ